MPRRVKDFSCQLCEVKLRIAWKDSVNHFLNWCPVCGRAQNSFDPSRDADPDDFDEFVQKVTKGPVNHKKQLRVGSLNVNDVNIEENQTYINCDYLLKKICPPLKIVPWSEVTKAASKYVESRHGIPDFTFTELGIESAARYYCKHLSEGWIDATGGGDGVFLNKDGRTNTISDNHWYYIGAKLHWLLSSVDKEGFWWPSICKLWLHNGVPITRWHPGTVRSKVINAFEKEIKTPVMVYDKDDLLDYPRATMSDVISLWRESVEKRYPERYAADDSQIELYYKHGALEIHHHHQVKHFKEELLEFNKEACNRSNDKKVNIYIGYDSTHKGLEDLCKFSIENYTKFGSKMFIPEIKILKHQDIEEYTRPYAEQSTEFTYSRFLVPYLENYEGYSIFVDDDILFNGDDILTFFMHLNPKDAVACVKYPYFDAVETKFKEEKNVSYSKKLWSSLMVFNNSHPDCKKLTPELINTASGKYLHQFEWTDQISRIPDKYILTSGYDTIHEKPGHLAVHYTNGGPWIQDMFTRGINLKQYDKLYSDYKKAKRWLYNPKKLNV